MSVVHENLIILGPAIENAAQTMGQKAAAKVVLHQLHIPTPPAFVIMPAVFQEFLHYKNGHNHWRTLLENCRPLSPDDQVSTSQGLQKLILNHEFEPELANQISETYHHVLKSHWAHLTISPTPMNKAPVNYPLPVIKGETVLLDFMRQIWAAQFSPHAISIYLNSYHKVALEPAPIIVSQFESATRSGTIISVEPTTKDKNLVLISAIWGTNPQTDPQLITPDEYVVAKNTGTIISRHLQIQKSKISIDRYGHYKNESIPTRNQTASKLNDKQLLYLLHNALKIHDYCLKPQVINWLSVDDDIFFTRFHEFEYQIDKPYLQPREPTEVNSKIIAHGLSASPGITTAPIIRATPKTILHNGRIVVFTEANEVQMKQARKAAGIIIERGGLSSETVIMAREIGIPVLVGTGTIKIKDNQIVTLDALHGVIKQNIQMPTAQIYTILENHQISAPKPKTIHTATKLYVNVYKPEPDQIAIYAKADGVGLCRGSDILANTDVHPKYLINHKPNEFAEIMNQALISISQQFGNRPIFYYPYAVDTATAKLQNHGKVYETTLEQNPLLGYRGAHRIFTDNQIFRHEMSCLKSVRNKSNCSNISLIIPLVRSVFDFENIKRLLGTEGIFKTPSLTFYVELSTPAAPSIIAKLSDSIDGIYINLDHLAALTLGYDPNCAEIDQFVDCKHESVIQIIKNITTLAGKYHLPVIASGYQLEQQPEAIELVIGAGVTGLSISSHRFDAVQTWVESTELKIVRES